MTGNNGTWGDLLPERQQKMTPVKALCLCLMALDHVQEESPGVDDWSKAESYVRSLLQRARQNENITV